MFGQGNFRPLMGQLTLAQSYPPGQSPVGQAPAQTPEPAQVAPAPAPVPAAVLAQVPVKIAPSSTTLAMAGIAAIAILGLVFFTD